MCKKMVLEPPSGFLLHVPQLLGSVAARNMMYLHLYLHLAPDTFGQAMRGTNIKEKKKGSEG